MTISKGIFGDTVNGVYLVSWTVKAKRCSTHLIDILPEINLIRLRPAIPPWYTVYMRRPKRRLIACIDIW